MRSMFRRPLTTATSKFRLAPTIKQLLAAPDSIPHHATSPSAEPSLTDSTSITVHGWIKSIRKQKHVAFAVVGDGSAPAGLQAVLVRSGERDDTMQRLTNGAAVRLTGKLVASPGRGQSHELLVDSGLDGKIEVMGECEPNFYPIQKKTHSAEFLRDNAHLRARTGHIASMLRLRNRLQHSLTRWFEEQGFCYAHTPILTQSDAEGAGEAFRIQQRHSSSSLPPPPSLPLQNPQIIDPDEFFSRPAYLTVSHQLHLEALATALSRVYTLSPCFRAEPSLTGRHLAEFWMLEAEWAFVSHNIEGICDLVEGCIRETVSNLLLIDEDVNYLWKDLSETPKWHGLVSAFSNPSIPWRRISYSDAILELERQHNNNAKFEYEPAWGRALQSEHERWLAEELVGGPVFVVDYPSSLKPFYMRVNEGERCEKGETVACFDLLVPHIGELAGGSVREERLDVLRHRMHESEMDESAYKWYEDLRKWGGAPHAGFGMGFERLVGWVGGIENVRECVAMPRWAGRMVL